MREGDGGSLEGEGERDGDEEDAAAENNARGDGDPASSRKAPLPSPRSRLRSARPSGPEVEAPVASARGRSRGARPRGKPQRAGRRLGRIGRGGVRRATRLGADEAPRFRDAAVLARVTPPPRRGPGPIPDAAIADSARVRAIDFPPPRPTGWSCTSGTRRTSGGSSTTSSRTANTPTTWVRRAASPDCLVACVSARPSTRPSGGSRRSAKTARRQRRRRRRRRGRGGGGVVPRGGRDGRGRRGVEPSPRAACAACASAREGPRRRSRSAPGTNRAHARAVDVSAHPRRSRGRCMPSDRDRPRRAPRSRRRERGASGREGHRAQSAVRGAPNARRCFEATVAGFDQETHTHRLEYDDGDVEPSARLWREHVHLAVPEDQRPTQSDDARRTTRRAREWRSARGGEARGGNARGRRRARERASSGLRRYATTSARWTRRSRAGTESTRCDGRDGRSKGGGTRAGSGSTPQAKARAERKRRRPGARDKRAAAEEEWRPTKQPRPSDSSRGRGPPRR